MEDAIYSIYKLAFGFWNSMMNIAINMFTASPSNIADKKLYEMIHYIFIMVSDVSLPIATIFFLITIVANSITTPQEQLFAKTFRDMLKYAVLLGLLANLWDVMGGVMSFADGFTNQIASVTANSSMDISNTALSTAIHEVCSQEPKTQVGFLDIEGLLQWIGEFMVIQLQIVALLVIGVITLIVIISSGLSILSGAFNRILKPLVILPFASITVAMAAGSHESERVAFSYFKTFFSFCISGAFMVICVKLGNVLATSSFTNLANSSDILGNAIEASVQCAITPVVIAGLVKSADSVLGRFL